MRNKILLLVSMILLFSCNSEDSNVTMTSIILCKKQVQNGITHNYFYENDKITSAIISSTSSSQYLGKLQYYYTGSLITKIEEYDESNHLILYYLYNYSNNKLTSLTLIRSFPLDDDCLRRSYSYNQNGTISYNEYLGNSVNQNTLVGSGTLSIVNGEVVNLTSISGAITTTQTATYDNKNAPFKNVLGWQELSIPFAFQGISNNTNSLTINGQTSTFIYNYDTNNFPISKQVNGINTFYYY